ncbi:hypothetical protein [Streptomyces sp. CNQ085]|uniref:hypothetical protein n=1 Tax=Streptomyces sp. CNQ085 TaxID=2886944 RepID=UPI001F50DCE2|nr:hypothetical protein [Streptomyces sp. CNQ085]MCI0386744.1 hypothetical protein [Streptomyces sp. CNQ085]
MDLQIRTLFRDRPGLEELRARGVRLPLDGGYIEAELFSCLFEGVADVAGVEVAADVAGLALAAVEETSGLAGEVVG